MLECVLNYLWIVGIVVDIVAEFHSRVVIVELGRAIFSGWDVYKGSAAEISVAKCFLKVLALRILIIVLVNMTNLQILTKLERRFGVIEEAKKVCKTSPFFLGMS